MRENEVVVRVGSMRKRIMYDKKYKCMYMYHVAVITVLGEREG